MTPRVKSCGQWSPTPKVHNSYPLSCQEREVLSRPDSQLMVHTCRYMGSMDITPPSSGGEAGPALRNEILMGPIYYPIKINEFILEVPWPLSSFNRGSVRVGPQQVPIIP